MHSNLFARACIAALCSFPVVAQATYNPNIGAALGAGDDTISPGLGLGFSFPFPNGSTTTSIDIDSNGRVLLPGAISDWTPSVAEMLANASAIYPFWDDLTFLAGATTTPDNIYFNALPNVALITWRDVRGFGFDELFTVQCQLHSDGRIWLLYDQRVPAYDPLVGVSAGGGAANPGATNWTTAGGLTTTVGTIYELFPANGFDLAGVSIELLPTGSGGYVVLLGSSGFPPVADSSSVGRACTTGLDFIPDGVGGYVVTPCSGCWIDPVAAGHTSLGITLDDQISGGNPLGFTFTWPGGTTSNAIDVDSNGRIIPPGTDVADFSPTIGEFLGDTFPTIAGFWIDFNINAVGGTVYFGTAPGSATVTWSGVGQYLGSTPLSAQTTLFSDGRVRSVFRDITGWNPMVGITPAAIIGLSPGNGVADPGESNLSGGTVASTGAVVYEFFDGAATEYVDLQMATNSLDAPVLGGTWNVAVVGVPSTAVLSALLIGFNNPNVELDLLPSLGLPTCVLSTDSGAGTAALSVSMGSSSFALPISTDPVLAGLQIYMQAASIAPGFNALGVALASGTRGRVGF